MFGSAGPLRPLRRTQAERHSGAEGTSLRWTQGPIPLICTAEKQVGWLVPSVGQGGTRWDLWRRRRTRGSRGCRPRRLRANGPRVGRSTARLSSMGPVAVMCRVVERPTKTNTMACVAEEAFSSRSMTVSIDDTKAGNNVQDRLVQA